MNGSDIRRYRKALKLDQSKFARMLGISQSALSLIETGRMAIPKDLLDRLSAAFDKPQFSPRFSEFWKTTEREQAQGEAALAVPHARQLTLLVWQWTSEFDLSRAPGGDQVVGAITVPFTEQRVIALRMPKASQAWMAGEILVFEKCIRDDLKDDDVVLVQAAVAPARAPRTVLGIAHVGRAARRIAHIEPLSPAGAMFQAEDASVATCMRATFRARQLS